MDITSSEYIIAEGKEKQAIKFILENCFRSGLGTLSKTELGLTLFKVILIFLDNVKATDQALANICKLINSGCAI